jgi:SAM-dependent methyltransferase
MPNERALRDAFTRHREMWPDDTYSYAEERYVKTYRLMRQFYQDGPIVDVGGWPGYFACSLALLDLPISLVDKDLSRPTAKAEDPATGQYILSGSTTLAEKCHRHGVVPVSCDIEREPLPLEDASAGLVIFTEVLEHLRVGPLFALRELRRILRPGGTLILTTPNLLSVRNRWCFLTGRADYDTMDLPYDALKMEERIGHPGHFRIYSLPELTDLLIRSGFRVLQHEYHNVSWGGSGKLPWTRYGMRLRLERGLTRLFPSFRNTMLLVATKDNDQPIPGVI